MVPGYDAAIPTGFLEAWVAGQTDRLAALRLAGVDYAVLAVRDPREPIDPRQSKGLHALADPLPGARLYRLTDSLPRIFLAMHAEVLSDSAAHPRLHEPEVLAGHSVWLAPDADARDLPAPPGRAGSCRLETYSDRRLTARCEGEQPGMAVVNEQFDPGWRAWVDGRPVALLRANMNMRAVPLAAGAHQIVMRYNPPGLWAGVLLSLISMLGLAGLALWGRRWPS
jgi:hypothetical protein